MGRSAGSGPRVLAQVLRGAAARNSDRRTSADSSESASWLGICASAWASNADVQPTRSMATVMHVAVYDAVMDGARVHRLCRGSRGRTRCARPVYESDINVRCGSRYVVMSVLIRQARSEGVRRSAAPRPPRASCADPFALSAPDSSGPDAADSRARSTPPRSTRSKAWVRSAARPALPRPTQDRKVLGRSDRELLERDRADRRATATHTCPQNARSSRCSSHAGRLGHRPRQRRVTTTSPRNGDRAEGGCRSGKRRDMATARIMRVIAHEAR